MTITESKSLPKSLHTVTAIVQVAIYIMDCQSLAARDAVPMALYALGYPDATDPHGLAAKALKVLEA